MRAFIAVDLNSKKIKQAIITIQRALINSGADIRLVDATNLHFTIRFLGEISELEANDISSVLKGIHTPSFKISFKGLGYFPNNRRISVVWIGTDEGSSSLIKLAEHIDEILKRLNITPQKKLTPHLTICRLKSGKNKDKLIQVANKFKDVYLGTDVVSSIKLKKSQLTAKGPIYSDLYTKILL